MSHKHGKISNLDKLRPGDHTVLIYEKEHETLATLVSFIKASLRRGEKCLYIEGDTNTELLIKTLKNEMKDFEKYIQINQVQFLTKEKTYALSEEFKADPMIDLIKEKAETALEQGYTGLSITGELSWVLNFKGGKKEIIDYEWKLNERLFNNYPVVALCRYNINKFDQEIIKAVLELHDYIIWNDKIHENPYYIEPEGYKNNKVVEYEIKAWLENIQKYKKRESHFKEKLEEKESEYKFLFNQISDAVYHHKITGQGEFSNFIMVNDKACEMLGYSREELLKLSPSDIVATEIKEKHHQRFDQDLNDQYDMTYESKHIRQDGSTIPVEINLTSYLKNDEKYLLAIVRDITKRKADEQKLLAAKEKLQAKNEELEANNEEMKAINDELEYSYQELDRLTNNFENLIQLISKIEVEMTEEDFLSVILRNTLDVIEKAEAGLIYIFRDNKVEFIDGVNYDVDLLNRLDIKKEHVKYHGGKDSKNITINSVLDPNLTPEHIYKKFMNNTPSIKNSLFVNLRVNQKVIGRLSLDILKESEATFQESSKRLLSSFERMASSHLTLKRYNQLQKKFTDDVILSLTSLLEIHDKYTQGHNEEVANLARKIAESMELGATMVQKTYRAGLLHDIGKIIIPAQILNKKGKLTDDEYDIIKKHPEWGYQALKNSEELFDLAEYILYHHERWDGKGYPAGLKGDKIPLISQILALADAWDAMTSKRSYHEPLSEKKAIDEILKNKSKQFSPEVTDCFLSLKGKVHLIKEK